MRCTFHAKGEIYTLCHAVKLGIVLHVSTSALNRHSPDEGSIFKAKIRAPARGALWRPERVTLTGTLIARAIMPFT
jgi:hypothetical protein